jgi:hypothetical protein
MDYVMEKVDMNGLTVVIIRVIGLKTWRMGMGIYAMLTGISSKVNGKMIQLMVKEGILMLVELLIRVSG